MILAGAALLGVLALPDLTIRTEQRNTPDNAGVTTAVLYIKDRNQRRESTLTLPNGSRTINFPTMFTECEQGRAVELNTTARVYQYLPLPPRVPSTQIVAARRPDLQAAPTAEMIIEHVDTGERRQIGSLVARHVVTTTTVAPESSPAAPLRVRTEDGWFIDVPPPDCGASGERYRALALVSGPGERLRITERGAPTGYPVDEHDRTVMSGRETINRTIRLVDASESPVDPALFGVPAGYRPALQLPMGGFDLSRPDTWRNRAEAYWEYASNWVRQLLR